jgi:hypothetical protein
MPVIIDGTNGITQAGEFNSDSSFGFKNRIINGAMVIDQRNGGASVTLNAGNNVTYTVDRWFVRYTTNTKFTVQQNAGSVTPPTGFTNYLGVTSTSGTLDSTDFFSIGQAVEGFNAADLDFGKSSAKTITVSFWVRSSLTGTFSGSVNSANVGSAGSRAYLFTYTILAANTWEYKTVTISGETSGTLWNVTNGTGVFVNFSFGAGASVQNTANIWLDAPSAFRGVAGQTQVVGTNGATFYITGVQLEAGSTATSFDYRSIGTELALSQRYFQKSYNLATAVGTATFVGIEWFTLGSYSGRIATTTKLSVPMRTSAAVVPYDSTGAANRVRTSAGDGQTGYVVRGPSENNFSIDYTSGGIAELLYQWTASAEL